VLRRWPGQWIASSQNTKKRCCCLAVPLHHIPSMSSTGGGWAQLRQQARTFEQQVSVFHTSMRS
jgi:hypothetical protein